MREVNWQCLDKDQIVELIINQSIEKPEPDLRSRIKAHLMALSASELWRKIQNEYDNKLYEEDVYVQTLEDRIALKRRELQLERERQKRIPTVIKKPVTVGSNYFSRVDDAENALYIHHRVDKVIRAGDDLVIIVNGAINKERLERYCTKKYDGIKITVIDREGKAI